MLVDTPDQEKQKRICCCSTRSKKLASDTGNFSEHISIKNLQKILKKFLNNETAANQGCCFSIWS